jgi:hypothetical protein
METVTTTTIRCLLDDGREMTLTAEDCASILNAMARSKLLEVIVAEPPAGEFTAIYGNECCAWSQTSDEDEDDRVYLEVDASRYTGFVRAEPVKPKKRRKSA